MQAEYAAYIRHALGRALGCEGVSDRGLSGRQIDKLKGLVLGPVCTEDLAAAVMADDAAVAGRPATTNRQCRATDTNNHASQRNSDVMCEASLQQSQRCTKRARTQGAEGLTTSTNPAPLQDISIRVCFQHPCLAPDTMNSHKRAIDGQSRSFSTRAIIAKMFVFDDHQP